MPDPKLLGGTSETVQQIATVTSGIGYPLLKVDGQAIGQQSEVLDAESFVDQEPTALDAPIQVSFGPAQFGPNDSVQVAADGTVTFNEPGTYIANVSLYIARPTNPGKVFLFFRVTKNGVQEGNPLGYAMNNQNETQPVFLGGIVTPDAGDVYRVEFYRDSQGQNEGGLQSQTPTLPWGQSPSARLSIRKV